MRTFLSALAVTALCGSAVAQTQNLVYITNATNPNSIAPSAGDIGDVASNDNTRKVVIVDLDGDGDQDVFFLNFNANSAGYINNGAGQLDLDVNGGALYTSTAGVGGKGVTFFDFDADGFQDCFIATGPVAGDQKANIFLRNNTTVPGNATAFVDETVLRGFGNEEDHSYDAAFTTINTGTDGAPVIRNAILVANRGITNQAVSTAANRLYIDNNNDGDWADLGELITPAASRFSSSTDAQQGYSRDLVLGNFRNLGGALNDVIVAHSGVQHVGIAGALAPMLQGIRLHRNSSGGNFPGPIASTTFATQTSSAFGIGAGDLDGDADLDVVVAARAGASTGEANQLWRNDSTVTNYIFSFQTGTVVDNAVQASYDVTIADLDDDGDNDIVVANNLDDNAVYMNNNLGFFAGGHFVQIQDGLIQSSRGQTRSAAVADFADYGPDANHQGAEVVFANAIAGTEQFYRGMGKQFFDAGNGTVAGITDINASVTPRLEGDGFFNPGGVGSGELELSGGENGAAVTVRLSLVGTDTTPLNGATVIVPADVTIVTALDGTGALSLSVPNGQVPAALAGTQIFVQAVTSDAALGGADEACTNAVSLVVQ